MLTRTGRTRVVRGEGGFTLVELLTATAVSLIISVALLAVIPTFMTAEVTTSRSDQAAASALGALTSLQHDIQSADPLDVLATVAAYDHELQVDLQSGGSTVTVTWVYDPSSGELTRQVGTAPAVVELTGVTDGPNPVFIYFGQHGQNLAAQSSVTPAGVVDCTTLVQVDLSVASAHAAADVSTTSVQLENRSPSVVTCG